MALLGCPFCQELRPDTEGRTCEVCGVPLVPVERLPPSYESRLAAAAALQQVPPEHRPLRWTYLGRGRGALALVAALGLAAFFAPWVEVTRPDEFVLSGFGLARARAPWYFAGAVGWFVLLPLVVTRRTIAALRGVRVAATTLAGLTLIEAILFWLTRPQGSRYVPVELSWQWGLYASAGLSVVGVVLGARLGGRVDDITLPRHQDPVEAAVEEACSEETLH
jgi:hypothetical protein